MRCFTFKKSFTLSRGPGGTTHRCWEIWDADARFHLRLLKCIWPIKLLGGNLDSALIIFILLNRTHSWEPGAPQSEQKRVVESGAEYVKHMQVMKMYDSSESVRQLINSRLRLRRGGRLAHIWYTGTLTNGIATWNQLSLSLVGLSSLWGSLCSNKSLIARAPVFFISRFISILQC